MTGLAARRKGYEANRAVVNYLRANGLLCCQKQTSRALRQQPRLMARTFQGGPNMTDDSRRTTRAHPNQGKVKPWLDAFLADPPQTDECIVWPFAGIGRGRYPAVKVDGKMTRVTRLVLERFVGPSEDGQHAAHEPITCHNHRCINPRHLRWATALENNRDRWIDGTAPIGQRSGHAKLTDAQVVHIYMSPGTHAELGRQFGVAANTIRCIRNGESWGWLTADLPERDC